MSENLSLTIHGTIPSKKNSRQDVNIKGRLISVPGKAYKEWHKSASNMIKPFQPFSPIEQCEWISIKFFMKDNMRRDLTNMAESINDLLVDCEFIVDDRWQITGPVLLYPAAIDRFNPRAEITIAVLK